MPFLRTTLLLLGGVGLDLFITGGSFDSPQDWGAHIFVLSTVLAGIIGLKKGEATRSVKAEGPGRPDVTDEVGVEATEDELENTEG